LNLSVQVNRQLRKLPLGGAHKNHFGHAATL
jgi:hypothetical protein